MLRNWRKMLGAMAVVLGMTVPILTVSGAASVQAAGGSSDCAPVATTALGSLCVESSSNGTDDRAVRQRGPEGRSGHEFKWLVNEDDSTGDPSFTAANVADCLPACAKPTAAEIASNPVLAHVRNRRRRQPRRLPVAVGAQLAGSLDRDRRRRQHQRRQPRQPRRPRATTSTSSRSRPAATRSTACTSRCAAASIYSVNEEVGKPFIVRMNPLPKKTTTIRVHVFNDNASTNSQWDGQTETLLTCDVATPQQVATNCGGSTDPNLVADPTTDMSGFSVHITDVLGRDDDRRLRQPALHAVRADSAATSSSTTTAPPTRSCSPTAARAVSAHAGTDSTCLSDHYGDIVIPNMGPNRYAVTVVPPEPTHAQRRHVDPHDHPRRWSRLGRMAHRRHQRLRHRADRRRRARSAGDRRLRQAHQQRPDVERRRAARVNGNPAPEAAYYSAQTGFLGGHRERRASRARSSSAVRTSVPAAPSPLAGTNLANAKEDGLIEDGVVSVSCIATCNAPTDIDGLGGPARTDGTFEVNRPPDRRLHRRLLGREAGLHPGGHAVLT